MQELGSLLNCFMSFFEYLSCAKNTVWSQVCVMHILHPWKDTFYFAEKVVHAFNYSRINPFSEKDFSLRTFAIYLSFWS